MGHRGSLVAIVANVCAQAAPKNKMPANKATNAPCQSEWSSVQLKAWNSLSETVNVANNQCINLFFLKFTVCSPRLLVAFVSHRARICWPFCCPKSIVATC